jgi:hypothetical protein
MNTHVLRKPLGHGSGPACTTAGGDQSDIGVLLVVPECCCPSPTFMLTSGWRMSCSRLLALLARFSRQRQAQSSVQISQLHGGHLDHAPGPHPHRGRLCGAGTGGAVNGRPSSTLPSTIGNHPLQARHAAIPCLHKGLRSS